MVCTYLQMSGRHALSAFFVLSLQIAVLIVHNETIGEETFSEV